MIYGIFGQSVMRLLNKVKVTKIFNRLVGATLIGMGLGLTTGKVEIKNNCLCRKKLSSGP